MTRSILIGILILGFVCCDLGELRLAEACAGHTLTVGSDGTQRQDLLAQIMSELIRQRTGTKIQLVRFNSQAELLAAAERCDVDLLVANITRVSATDIGLFKEDKLRLLKPFGYQDSQVMPAFQVATLKRFPALQRLINRLAGIIDDATLLQLEEGLTADSDLRTVARKFLAEQKLIFGS